MVKKKQNNVARSNTVVNTASKPKGAARRGTKRAPKQKHLEAVEKLFASKKVKSTPVDECSMCGISAYGARLNVDRITNNRFDSLTLAVCGQMADKIAYVPKTGDKMTPGDVKFYLWACYYSYLNKEGLLLNEQKTFKTYESCHLPGFIGVLFHQSGRLIDRRSTSKYECVDEGLTDSFLNGLSWTEGLDCFLVRLNSNAANGEVLFGPGATLTFADFSYEKATDISELIQSAYSGTVPVRDISPTAVNTEMLIYDLGNTNFTAFRPVADVVAACTTLLAQDRLFGYSGRVGFVDANTDNHAWSLPHYIWWVVRNIPYDARLSLSRMLKACKYTPFKMGVTVVNYNGSSFFQLIFEWFAKNSIALTVSFGGPINYAIYLWGAAFSKMAWVNRDGNYVDSGGGSWATYPTEAYRTAITPAWFNAMGWKPSKCGSQLLVPSISSSVRGPLQAAFNTSDTYSLTPTDEIDSLPGNLTIGSGLTIAGAAPLGHGVSVNQVSYTNTTQLFTSVLTFALGAQNMGVIATSEKSICPCFRKINADGVTSNVVQYSSYSLEKMSCPRMVFDVDCKFSSGGSLLTPCRLVGPGENVGFPLSIYYQRVGSGSLDPYRKIVTAAYFPNNAAFMNAAMNSPNPEESVHTYFMNNIFDPTKGELFKVPVDKLLKIADAYMRDGGDIIEPTLDWVQHFGEANYASNEVIPKIAGAVAAFGAAAYKFFTTRRTVNVYMGEI